MTSKLSHRFLSLRAEDEEDFAVISTLLQDAEVKLVDMTFLGDEQKFIVLVSRFVRETLPANALQSQTKTRVLTGLCFEGVKSVRTRNIVFKARNTLLRFLSVSYVRSEITLVFSEGGAIKLQGENVICWFRDLCAQPKAGESSV